MRLISVSTTIRTEFISIINMNRQHSETGNYLILVLVNRLKKLKYIGGLSILCAFILNISTGLMHPKDYKESLKEKLLNTTMQEAGKGIVSNKQTKVSK